MPVSRSVSQYGLGLALGVALTAAVATWSPRQHAVAVPSEPVPQAAYDMAGIFRSVSADVMPSVVSITTVTRPRQVEMQGGPSPFDDENSPFREFFRNDPRFQEFFRQPRRGMTPRRQGAGSGFIIDPSGVIMTNNHVVAGADEVRVHLGDGREYIATDIKTDPRSDVAIVRIKDAGKLKAVKLGDSRNMEVGDWVLAFGSPFGLDMTVTQGIISGKGRTRSGRIADREDFLQTDAAINPGNSGGPLVNLKGEVIGINTAIASASGGYDGIGFAIPTHIASWVGDQLSKNGEVKRGYLGTSIATVDADTAKQFGVNVREGVIVKNVMPSSPAEKGGLEPGDVILKLDGQPVVDAPSLQGIVERLDVGKSYPVDVIREGKRTTLNVTVEAMPVNFASRNGDTTPSTPKTPAYDDLGLAVSPLTKDLAKQFDLPNNVTGVVVTSVREDSAAEAAGVQNGDIVERVGNTTVTSVEEFEKAVKGLSVKDGVVLHLRNADGKRYVIVKAVTE
jgi:serine protease Do